MLVISEIRISNLNKTPSLPLASTMIDIFAKENKADFVSP
jgi:hypothetical protein